MGCSSRVPTEVQISQSYYLFHFWGTIFRSALACPHRPEKGIWHCRWRNTLIQTKMCRYNNTEQAWFLNHLIDKSSLCVFFWGYITGMLSFMWCTPGIHHGSPSFCHLYEWFLYKWFYPIHKSMESSIICRWHYSIFANKDPDIVKHTLETVFESA